MKHIKTISTFEKKLTTKGSSPIVFWCDDFHYYACKYGKPNNLFNEYLAASFCKIWKIPVPDFSLVTVKEEHIPEGYPKGDFSYPCFGSFYLEHAWESGEFLNTWESKNYDLEKICNPNDLLKVGLFDLWLCNEDRNHNNNNLLINPTKEGFQIVAIDHVAIFNSNSFDFKLTQLTEDEVITNTKFCNLLFKRGAKLNESLEDLEKNFYLCIKGCSKNLSKILSEIPSEWGIDVVEREKRIRENLFDETWIKQTISYFRTVLESSLDKK
ncbi:HipA family kinase [Flavobacterium filum]|uniref:HipA family kinase n=1 Tax=Flavobacterium filum TaxID=370974 RepID=UPI0023F271D6|nr:HipA family kinase [Flavobacterium filum]